VTTKLLTGNLHSLFDFFQKIIIFINHDHYA